MRLAIYLRFLSISVLRFNRLKSIRSNNDIIYTKDIYIRQFYVNIYLISNNIIKDYKMNCKILQSINSCALVITWVWLYFINIWVDITTNLLSGRSYYVDSIKINHVLLYTKFDINVYIIFLYIVQIHILNTPNDNIHTLKNCNYNYNSKIHR